MNTRQFEAIELSGIAPHVGQIMLNRPDADNMIDSQMTEELRDVLSNYQKYFADPRVLILTGSGQKAFCAGCDATKEQKDAVISAIIRLPIPIIAAVNGEAYADGLEVALACDFIVASGHTNFACNHMTPDVVEILVHSLGIKRAKKLLYTREIFSAIQAKEWGLVNEIASSEFLLAETVAIAEKIAANDPAAICAMKAAI